MNSRGKVLVLEGIFFRLSSLVLKAGKILERSLVYF